MCPALFNKFVYKVLNKYSDFKLFIIYTPTRYINVIEAIYESLSFVAGTDQKLLKAVNT